MVNDGRAAVQSAVLRDADSRHHRRVWILRCRRWRSRGDVMELLCLAGVAIFFLVVMPAMNASGRQSEAERNAEALDRLTRK